VERQRLARDLHDSVTQLIFSITLIAQSLKPAWERDPLEGAHRVNRLIELSQSALAEMRALLAELRPAEPLQEQKTSQSAAIVLSSMAQIQEHGLVATLHKYINVIAGESLQVNVMSDDYTKQPPRYEETLYRIAQEALNNIVKHAQAQAATVTLYNDAGSIYLIVTDNGVGLSTLVDQAQQVESQPQIKSGAGLGLMTMRERAELLGGTFQLKSASVQGTTVVVTIPRSWTKPFTSDGPAFSG
jgi:signal transduction histidine kinase